MDESRLQELIEEATVDCYDEYEAFGGFFATLEDELPFPFESEVLGDTVKVSGLSERSSERRGVLVELEKKGKTYVYPLSELDVKKLDETAAEWVAAYQFWSN